MSNRDQNRGFGGGRGGEPPRRDDPRRPGERDRPWEGRSFGERGRFNSDEDRYGQGSRGRGGEPWRAEGRYGARYDEDRAGYGGQEYGMEGGRDHEMRREPRRRGGRGDDERETWRPDVGEPYGDLELNPRNRGIQEFGPPADYAYHPHAGHEFDPDYLHWRDEQMRSHDRDYQEWRRSQQQSYDEDYRRFRTERREHFGRTFSDWRSQRSPVGGVPDTGVAPGVSGYGAKVGMPTGYEADASSKPSGTIESPHSMNASPGAGQTGGSAEGGLSGRGAGGDASPEFGKEPPQVQAASGGWDTRGPAQDKAQDRANDDRDETKKD
jgi:hypothetical protein